MKKLIMTFFVLAIGGIGFFLYDALGQTEGEGTITIIVIDENDEIVYQEEHSFTEEDTLFSILKDTFTMSCANSSYQASPCTDTAFFGTVILAIDDISTDWYTDYIAIYVNDEYSTNGIDNIALNDGDVYRFEYTLVEELTP